MSNLKIELLEKLKNIENDDVQLRDVINSGEHDESFEKLDSIQGLPLEDDSYSWTEKYYASQVESLKENFSKERLLHLIIVKDYLKSIGAKGFVLIKNEEKPSLTTTVHESVFFKMHESYLPSKNLKHQVDGGDIGLIRAALLVELDNNRLDSDEISLAVEWVESKFPNIFVPYEETVFSKNMDVDAANWSYSYYTRQKIYFQSNLAKERFLHLIKVRNYLREAGEPSLQKIQVASKPKIDSVVIVQTQVNDYQHQPSDPISHIEESKKESLLAFLLSHLLSKAALVGGLFLLIVLSLISKLLGDKGS